MDYVINHTIHEHIHPAAASTGEAQKCSQKDDGINTEKPLNVSYQVILMLEQLLSPMFLSKNWRGPPYSLN